MGSPWGEADENERWGHKFKKLSRLGSGAYGDVLLAEAQPGNGVVAPGTRVAIKAVMVKDLKPEDLKGAVNEVVILSSLTHPHVISYYHYLTDNVGFINVIMEHASNGDLGGHIRRLKDAKELLPESEIWRFAGQIARALAYLHGRKIIHRDLKPGNIFLDDLSNAKLGDFGISKVLSTTSMHAITFLGTPFYVAPELCAGLHYDFAADMWAYGCIVYELCTLTPPFNGGNFLALVNKITTGKYPPLTTTSEALVNLIQSLLQQEPKARPSASQIVMLYFDMPEQLMTAEETQRVSIRQEEDSLRRIIELQVTEKEAGLSTGSTIGGRKRSQTPALKRRALVFHHQRLRYLDDECADRSQILAMEEKSFTSLHADERRAYCVASERQRKNNLEDWIRHRKQRQEDKLQAKISAMHSRKHDQVKKTKLKEQESQPSSSQHEALDQQHRQSDDADHRHRQGSPSTHAPRMRTPPLPVRTRSPAKSDLNSTARRKGSPVSDQRPGSEGKNTTTSTAISTSDISTGFDDDTESETSSSVVKLPPIPKSSSAGSQYFNMIQQRKYNEEAVVKAVGVGMSSKARAKSHSGVDNEMLRMFDSLASDAKIKNTLRNALSALPVSAVDLEASSSSNASTQYQDDFADEVDSASEPNSDGPYD